MTLFSDMEFRKLLLQDSSLIAFLETRPDLIRDIFDIPGEINPATHLIHLSNTVEDVVDAQPPNTIFFSNEKQCMMCRQPLAIKKSMNINVFDDVLGTRRCVLITKCCKSCKLTVYPGYVENYKSSIRIYYDNFKEYPIFVSTHCTAFTTDFLATFVALKQKCHTTFIGRTNAYNYKHSYHGKNAPPESALNHNRLIEAYFKFIYVDFKKRYQLPLKMKTDVEEAIEATYDDLYKSFTDKYEKHECSIKGCETCLVIDGHMKAHRKVCKSKGCTQNPQNKSLYCKEHDNDKHQHTINHNNEQNLLEGEFHIENILHKSFVKQKKQWLYEVKWQGYEDTTLEPKENIPRILVELYEIYGSAKMENEVLKYFESAGKKYVHIKVKINNEEQEDLILPASAMEVDEQAYLIPSPAHVECNTEKTKKRFYHRTGGILVMAKPCGIILHASEIFGAEAISTVAESIEKTLQDVSNKIQWLIYDDACHLCKHCRNRLNVYPNINKCGMKVDRFHFDNHVDPWCKLNMNPDDCPDLDDVNTMVMEQTFSWIKGFSSSLKYMKRANFKFMLLDVIDRHNEEINDRQ